MTVAFPDTIVALSSGRLPSGVAIVRVSGRQCRFAVETIAGILPRPRQATYRKLQTASGEHIDTGLVLFFPGPASFTGEDCAEFQVHGGKAVVAALLGVLTSFPSVRHAEPGEFTRRAFLNGKMDLVETEGLADLISAETEAQRRMALRNAGGAQSELYAHWRQGLIHARAMIEAELDFSDESDIPGSISDRVWADIRQLKNDMTTHISRYRRSEIVRDGYDVVIVGAPNAGKSSLLNALANRDVAIVSDEPGTTRDTVELALDLDGLKVRLTDTAGLRENAGKVESIGIERARKRAEEADLVILLRDGSVAGLPEEEINNTNVIVIQSKADLPASTREHASGNYELRLSAKSGIGISQLIELLTNKAEQAVGNYGDILPSRLRHIELLKEAVRSLEQSLSANQEDLELRAEDLRVAADRLGRISGAVDVEDLLDVIFSQFCIGK